MVRARNGDQGDPYSVTLSVRLYGYLAGPCKRFFAASEVNVIFRDVFNQALMIFGR